MLRRSIAALSLIFAISGCSSTYELRAVLVDGKVAFVPAKTDMWGEPDCIYSISVSAVNGPPAEADEDDSTGMVENGVYWNESFAVTSCENPFPIIYGETLSGPAFREDYKNVVKPKPLRVGVIYEITTASEGSAYGGGMFMITTQQQVINVPHGASE